MSITHNTKKLVFETDFAEGDGWYIELVRPPNSGPGFVKFEIDTQKIIFGKWFKLQGRVFVPPEEDELTRHVRLAQNYDTYVSVRSLLEKIDTILSRCLDIDAGRRFLLACFVLSTWVVDRLPIAPIIAIVGPSQSGKTTALNALHLLCRRGLITSDISSAAFYRNCDRLIPTLFIDDIATTGQERQLSQLLRSGTISDIMGLRGSQSYRTYGAKVVSWTELPDDDALNSRFIIIPMQETSRTDLLRTTDPEIVVLGDELRARLLNYRFEKYSKLRLSQIPRAKNLRSRDRDIYEALAFPIADDPEACARLLECMEQQHGMHTQSLPPDRTAVLETLFRLIHLQPEQGTLAFRHLTDEVNVNLEQAGECFRLSAKGVGTALTSLKLFSARKRISSGSVGFLDRVTRKRIHDLVSRHGMGGLADGIRSEIPGEPCEFCKARDAQNLERPPTEGSTGKLPTESADRKQGDVVQPPIQPQNDQTQSLDQPNLGGAQSAEQTDDIASSRWIENQEDQDRADKFEKDAELS